MGRCGGPSQLKLWTDSDELTDVFWYVCPDDATALPYWHSFERSYNIRDGYYFDVPPDGVGEVTKVPTWAEPEPPFVYFKSNTVCGPQEAFLGTTQDKAPNLTWTDYGVSTCCFENCPCADILTETGGDILLEDGSGDILTELQICCACYILLENAFPIELEDGSGYFDTEDC
jgi:hypothetical protein